MNSEDMRTCKKCGAKNRYSARFCFVCGSIFERGWSAGQTCIQFSQDNIEDSSSNKNIEDKELKSRFQLNDVIHKDENGKIYKATDKIFNNDVIFKEDKEYFYKKEKLSLYQNNFMSSGKILQRIVHPQIPAIQDCFYENNKYCVIIDYIKGKSLSKILRSEKFKKLKIKFSLKCILAVCELLEVFHNFKSPLCHLNIKPSKIIIDSKGKVYLIPWVQRPGRYGDLIGTKGFASPEQYQGEYDIRSDIYSLGALLYFLLTGKDPEKEAPFHFLPLSILRPDLSGKIESILRKALDLKPKNRFKSVNDFRREIIASAGKYIT